MAVTLLTRLAAAAPVPVFVARGGGAGMVPAELHADTRLRLVTSARHATVLLAAGRFPAALGEALDRLHDQLAQPRRTVWWTPDASVERPACLEEGATVVTGSDPVGAVVAAHRAALTEPASADPPVLRDEPPNPFEGGGDHGQGGEGMMGGVPYGRPMAMTADDRDGLALDQLPVVFGPFLLGLPNGVQVRAVLQGGTLQGAQLEQLDLGDGPPLPGSETDRGGPCQNLRWVADALRLAGLDALGRRAAGLARSALTDRRACASLARAVRRSGLPATWSGIGVLDGEDARLRLERRLRFDEPADGIPLGRVAGSLPGQDWSDALVTVWSASAPDAVASAAQGRSG